MKSDVPIMKRKLTFSLIIGFLTYAAFLYSIGNIFAPGFYEGSKFYQHPMKEYLVHLMITGLLSIFFSGGAAVVAYSFYPEKKADSLRPQKRKGNILKDVMWDLLSPDEKIIMTEIIKTDGVTQDSIINRLDFSKAKLSLLLTSLEDKGLVMRQKVGRTNKLLLTEKTNSLLDELDS